jgi:hypothetical protein
MNGNRRTSLLDKNPKAGAKSIQERRFAMAKQWPQHHASLLQSSTDVSDPPTIFRWEDRLYNQGGIDHVSKLAYIILYILYSLCMISTFSPLLGIVQGGYVAVNNDKVNIKSLVNIAESKTPWKDAQAFFCEY